MKSSKSVRNQVVGIESVSSTYAKFIQSFMTENEMLSCCIAGLDECNSLYVVKALAYFSAELLKNPAMFPGLFESLTTGNHCLSEEGVLAAAERFSIRFEDFFNDDQWSRYFAHLDSKVYEY